jgi:hypothetical protein
MHFTTGHRLLLMPLIIVATCTSPSTAFARDVRAWTIGELFDKSDVVVIVNGLKAPPTPVANGGDYLEETWERDLEAVQATLLVEHVVKGEWKRPSIVIVHARELKHRNGILAQVINGPRVISIADSEQLYLLFLKQNEGGVFIPVTGQYDSIDSCYRLEQ